MRDEFVKETDMLKRLSHPNIITIYEMFEDEKWFYLVTELCQGYDLFEEFSKRKHPYSEREAASIMYEVLLAINHCHSEKICHRDLKPENIILDNKKKVKIIDFGTAESNETGTGMEGIIGTAYYIAPEVLKAKNHYNEQCDIWSLGVILFLLLTA